MTAIPRLSPGALFAALTRCGVSTRLCGSAGATDAAEGKLAAIRAGSGTAWTCRNERDQIFSVAQAVLQGSRKRRALPNNNHGHLGYGTDGHSARPDRAGRDSRDFKYYCRSGFICRPELRSFGLIATGGRFASLTRGASRQILCVAGAPVGKAAITALGEARTISVDVLNTNLVVLTATVPTDQFSSAYKGAPAEIIEQIIEE